MEEVFREIAGYIALLLEATSALIIAYGAIKAIFRLLLPKYDKPETLVWRKTVFLHFGAWLILGLEFELAADIVRSAIAPSWESIGKLAAIAAIRTFLNYFLEKDVEKYAVYAHATETFSGDEHAAKRECDCRLIIAEKE
ncbi:MAG: DUF1622 domain-containing protein [Blastocatellia bacterium]|nr:DUF1622 domain-containing protein [Blastocatellia bacterium]